MMSRSFQRLAMAGVLAGAGLVLLVGPAEAGNKPAKPAKTVPVRLLSLNDFHGNLEPPTGSSGRMVDENGATVDAGGAAYVGHAPQAAVRQRTR